MKSLLTIFFISSFCLSQECNTPFWDPFELFGYCGCTLNNACNYDPSASYDDNSTCIIPEEFYNCLNDCINDMDNDGTCDEIEIYGCTDELACNYNQFVSQNDNSCVYLESECDICENNIIVNNDLDNDGICDYNDECVINISIQPLEDITICDGESIELNSIASTGSFSLDFPNISQYVGNAYAIIENDSAFNILEDFTIEFWLKDEGSNYWQLMGNNNFGDNNQGWVIKKPNENLMFGWTYDPNEFNFHEVNINEWEHIAVCYDDLANKFQYFKNGELINIEIKDANVNPSIYDFIIGKESGAENWFKGKIDNLRISDNSRYNTNSFDPFETFTVDSNTIAMYNFNEGSGNTAYDISGNQRHLNLYNTNYSTDTPIFNEFFIWSNGFTESSVIVSPSVTTLYSIEYSNDDYLNCYNYAEIIINVEQPTTFYNCDNECINDIDNDLICDELENTGCTDNNACNYNQFVIQDDGSCQFPEFGFDCQGNCILEDLDNDGICDSCEEMIYNNTDSCNCNLIEYEIFQFDVDEENCITFQNCSCECINDIDQDNICDEQDDCIGEYDVCGVCNGSGPNPFYNCIGDCINDLDQDEICDEIDECVGQYDICGECNGLGPSQYYDCNGDCINDIDQDNICDEYECSLVICEPGYECELGDCICINDFDNDNICDELDCSPFIYNPEQDCNTLNNFKQTQALFPCYDILGRPTPNEFNYLYLSKSKVFYVID